MCLNKNEKTFLTLVRMGLWENEHNSLTLDNKIFSEILQLAKVHTVVGIVAAGVEFIDNQKLPKEYMLELIGNALQIESRNTSMNLFIRELFGKFQAAGINAVLLKGQGISQCYERPLWRASGDIDLLLDDPMYIKAYSFLSPLANSIEDEDSYMKHIAMAVSQWEIELHGNIRGSLGKRIDDVLDSIKDKTLNEREIRVWMNGDAEIFLPEANNDVIFIFSHILQHFFKGGIGLRQVCDWCRLLWTFKQDIDTNLLSDRISSMGLWTEWKSFAALAVNSLGMPADAMPFYIPNRHWKDKANRILRYILDSGNFGLNKDISYRTTLPFFMRKMVTLFRITDDSIKLFFIFPKDTTRVWARMIKDGIMRTVNKK